MLGKAYQKFPLFTILKTDHLLTYTIKDKMLEAGSHLVCHLSLYMLLNGPQFLVTTNIAFPTLKIQCYK